ncbi:MAG: apolipoprotein N-acyltransferase [Candidatus Brocadiia bacterium]
MEEQTITPEKRRFPLPKKAVLLAVVSGILLYISFPPVSLWFCALFALAPLIYVAMGAASWRRAAFYGLLAGLTAYLPGLIWLSSVTVVGWIGLSFYVSLYLVLAAVFVYVLATHGGELWPVLMSFGWVGLEFVRARFITGFPWLLLGYSQQQSLGILQLASVTGVYGISWIVIFININIARTGMGLASRRLAPKKWHVSLFWLAASLILYESCGAIGLHWVQNAKSVGDETMRVGIVQHNVPRRLVDIQMPTEVLNARKRLREEGESLDTSTREELQKKIHDYYRQIDRRMLEEIDKAVRLSRKLKGENPDLIVWPETTVQLPLNVTPKLIRDPDTRAIQVHALNSIKELARDFGCHVLVGAPAAFARDAGYVEEVYYGMNTKHSANSAVLFSPAGEYIDRYDKMHLVPFGEYVPLVDLLPFLQVFTPMTRQVTPGAESVIFKVRLENDVTAKVAAPVCYEDVVAQLMRRFRRKGAEVLINITDEGWYRPPGEQRQHAAMAVFRAVETRTDVIRVANTGISGFISRRGIPFFLRRSTERGKLASRNVSGAMVGEVHLSREETIYMAFGDWFAWTSVVISGAFLAYLLGKRWFRRWSRRSGEET